MRSTHIKIKTNKKERTEPNKQISHQYFKCVKGRASMYILSTTIILYLLFTTACIVIIYNC